VKVGDLIRAQSFHQHISKCKLFIVMRREINPLGHEIVWIYPDPEPEQDYDHTDDDNYYFADLFEVLSESR